jgi:hypothetical protein
MVRCLIKDGQDYYGGFAVPKLQSRNSAVNGNTNINGIANVNGEFATTGKSEHNQIN